MSTTPTDKNMGSGQDETAAAPLGWGWWIGAGLSAAGAIVLAVGGFVNSFAKVEAAVEPSFGDLAWTVPLMVDVGIVVFTGIDLLFCRLRIRVWWLPLIPKAGIGVTIFLNVSSETTAVGVVAHAAAPVLWFLPAELAKHAMRRRAGLQTEQAARRAAGRMDRVRFTRWLADPLRTLQIRYWMITQEEPSYETMLTRLRARREAKWELQDIYGRLAWRWDAPRRARGLYRDARLAPSRTVAGRVTVSDLIPAGKGAPLAPAQDARPSAGGLEPGRRANGTAPPAQAARAGRNDSSGDGGARKRVTDTELLDAGRRVAAERAARGEPLTFSALGQAVRAVGVQVGNGRISGLLEQLQAEQSEAAR